MRRIIRVFADTTGDYDPGVFIMTRERFYSAILQCLGDRAVLGDGCVEIPEALEEDSAVIQEASKQAGVQYDCVVEYEFSPSEYERALLVRLAIEGEGVDRNTDGRPLNRYPKLLCRSCLMPDEQALPDPYHVLRPALLGDEDNYWGEGRLSSNREIFSGECGVFVASSRVRNVLQSILGEALISVPARFGAENDTGPVEYWALRPAINWGHREGREELAVCEVCGRSREARLTSGGKDGVGEGRLLITAHEVPEAEIACAEAWFGDRKETPFGFGRDIFVSGRLYSLLLKIGVRGLCPPSEPVWLNGQVPMRDQKESSHWVKAYLKNLESGESGSTLDI